jgi:hypothetical protein
MKLIKTFFTLSALLGYLSCGMSKEKPCDENTLAFTSTFDENSWSFKFFKQKDTDYQLLFLNEKDNIIGDITNVKLFDNYILIYEQGRDLLLLYDSSGEFITKVGKKGNGPGEYSRITYYDMYSKEGESVIEILDANRWELQVYDLSGELIKATKLKSDLDYFSFIHTDAGYFFYTPDNKENYMLVLFSSDLKEIKNQYIYDEWNLVPKVDVHFVKNTRDNLFHYGYNDTIYKIEGEQVKPYIEVDFGLRKVADSEVVNTRTLKDYKQKLYYSGNTYLGNINSMMLNDTRLIYHFGEIKLDEFTSSYYGELDLNNGESLFYKGIATEYPFSFSIIALQKDFSLGIIYPYHLSDAAIGYFKEHHGKDVSTSSNPIFIKLYD